VKFTFKFLDARVETIQTIISLLLVKLVVDRKPQFAKVSMHRLDL